MRKHLNIRVFGRVHDVNFRYFARKKAEKLGLGGLVRNEYDPSSVYMEAEGEEEALKKFADWCRKGPWPAKVTEMQTEEGEPKGFTEFIIQK